MPDWSSPEQARTMVLRYVLNDKARNTSMDCWPALLSPFSSFSSPQLLLSPGNEDSGEVLPFQSGSSGFQSLDSTKRKSGRTEVRLSSWNPAVRQQIQTILICTCSDCLMTVPFVIIMCSNILTVFSSPRMAAGKSSDLIARRKHRLKRRWNTKALCLSIVTVFPSSKIAAGKSPDLTAHGQQ